MTTAITYDDIIRTLNNNGLPHKVVKLIGGNARRERILSIEIFADGILMNKKERIVKELFKDEPVKVHASKETISVSIPFFVDSNGKLN